MRSNPERASAQPRAGAIAAWKRYQQTAEFAVIRQRSMGLPDHVYVSHWEIFLAGFEMGQKEARNANR